MSLDDEYDDYRYTPAPHAHCHVCGHRVRLTDRRPRVMYRHRYGGQTGSDWCVGSREKVGAIIPGFIGPYSRDPRPKGISEHTRTTNATSKERDMSSLNVTEGPYTLEQKQRAARILQARNGWVPTHEEVIELLEEAAANNRKYVGVTFAPSDLTMRARPQIYTYRVAEGEPVSIGEYLQVYSPITDQAELVRVVRLGKGDWTGATKIAHRINWTLVD
jgi:Tfp pilus assembly protein PilP